jgi:hypothetical protein
MWLVQFGGQGRAADAPASIRMVAADAMVFAGVDAERGFHAARPSTPSEE